MFTIRGSSPDTRRAWSRRDVLRVGLAWGAGLAQFGAGAYSAAAPPDAGDLGQGFGRAKHLILVYLFGGPSHLDIWDMKPAAPTGIRGEFRPIATNVPGIEITEHLPRLARMADRYAILRSLSHGDSAHGSASHTMLTGRRPRNLGEVPPREDDYPHYGAVLSRLQPTAPGVAPFVAYPWKIATSTNVVPGQTGGFLGASLDPWSVAPGQQSGRVFEVPLAALPEGVSPARLSRRRDLIDQMAGAEATWGGDFATIQQRAFDLLLEPRFLDAFRVEQEPAPLRERYGQNLFGQSLLLARRLVEAGVRTTVVYWPDRSEPEAFNNNGTIDKVAVAAWDTHGYHVGNTPNFPRLKDHNLPPLDLGLSALLEDLAARGLYDETLVAVTGEFGRSPKINGDGGRDHYGNVFSALLCGGGIRGGQVYGASDAIGAYPAERPVSAGDFAATLYHALGIRPETEVYDRLGRPQRVADGAPVVDLF
ncbi:MAG: DUF1501 domain-containing protein [Pirellulales bacterium]|nr:DUF1501 domain-containing protein [Pirellulales bacterium]